jgi:Fe-S cluster biogenesis protein NfuA
MMPFSDEDLCEAVKNFLPITEEYIKSHQGTVNFLGVKNGVAYIELGGTCNGCSMSTMTTKMVIQKRLREFIHPELNVESVFPGQTDLLPNSLVECN